jgi:hypothetical protein
MIEKADGTFGNLPFLLGKLEDFSTLLVESEVVVADKMVSQLWGQVEGEKSTETQ